MTDQDQPGRKRTSLQSDELAEVRLYQGGEFNTVPDPHLPRALQIKPKFTFWEDISSLAQECDDTLKAAGLPLASLGVPAGYKDLQVFSEEWFAAKIGLKCFHIMAGKETKSDWTLENTLSLGQLLQERTWRRLHKVDAVLGKKNRAATSNGGKKRRGKLGKDTPKILDEMRRLTDKLKSANAAAARVAPKFGKKPSGVLSLWYRHNK